MIHRHIRHHAALAATAIALAIALPTQAGPLTPPAGTPAPTNKTLQQVEPRIDVATLPADGTGLFKHAITAPGSYYLAANVIAEHSGITVRTGGVTLDLAGFAVTTTDAPHPDGLGVYVEAPGNTGRQVIIMNGLAVDFARDGFASTNTGDTGPGAPPQLPPPPIVLHNLHASGCGQRGFDLSGESYLTNCTASNNQVAGFQLRAHSPLTNCVASHSGIRGFDLRDAVLARGCASSGNTFGFVLTDHATAINCDATANTADGFSIGGNSRVEGSAASANGGIGVEAVDATLVISNRASANAIANYDIAPTATRGEVITVGPGILPAMAPSANLAY